MENLVRVSSSRITNDEEDEKSFGGGRRKFSEHEKWVNKAKRPKNLLCQNAAANNLGYSAKKIFMAMSTLVKILWH